MDKTEKAVKNKVHANGFLYDRMIEAIKGSINI